MSVKISRPCTIIFLCTIIVPLHTQSKERKFSIGTCSFFFLCPHQMQNEQSQKEKKNKNQAFMVASYMTVTIKNVIGTYLYVMYNI